MPHNADRTTPYHSTPLPEDRAEPLSPTPTTLDTARITAESAFDTALDLTAAEARETAADGAALEELLTPQTDHRLRLTSLQERAAILIAHGTTSLREAASILNISPTTLSDWTRQPLFDAKVRTIRTAAGLDAIRSDFKALLPRAIEVTTELMNDSTITASTRLDAAKSIIDRCLGKPTQPVETRTTTLRDILDQLTRTESAHMAADLSTLSTELSDAPTDSESDKDNPPS